ncbi:MAG TPA: UDP-N-acetylmuramoyl-tripeptide--D-alanyl-D-alanine ligase [Gaiellaceae bacterium]
MIPVPLEQIAALSLGRLDGDVPGGVVRRIVADSRSAGTGDLFVALNRGVDFVADARARGAATLVPDDQHAALAALATLVRARSSARVVAVVGSTGKTSTKDILGALCAAVVPTVFAEASLNNEIGLPLTVCRLEPETEVLVTEMGMRGLGQIAELCAVARPHVALVTHIGPEHLELVGTVAAVARANAEAIEALPAGGIAVVPAGADELEPYLGRDDIEVRRFDAAAVERSGEAWRFRLGERELELGLPFSARHMAGNALAALTAYEALGLPLERAHEGASRIRLSRWRGELLPLPGGGFVVNDAYNANPASLRAALLDLAERGRGRRRLAILGGMAELGATAPAYHREAEELARSLEIEVIAVGELGRLYGADRWVPDAAAATSLAGETLEPGDAVLVKASRAVGLEGIPERLANIAGEWSS